MKYPIQKKYNTFKQRREKIKSSKPPVNARIAVPSFFTLMNLFCGFLAIISISDGNLVWGAWLIMAAGLFDVFDGLMARLADADSDFGIELDSLSDVVSFGVAPGFLIYSFALYEFNFLGIIISAIPPLCGAVRLARFNVNARLAPSKDTFIGLPIPSQAIILIAFFLAFRNDLDLFDFFNNGVYTVLVPLVVIVSFLMVSTIPFDKIPRFDKESIKNKKWNFVLFLSYLTLMVLFKEYGLIIAILIYISKGVIGGAIRFFKDDYTGEEEPFQDFS